MQSQGMFYPAHQGVQIICSLNCLQQPSKPADLIGQPCGFTHFRNEMVHHRQVNEIMRKGPHMKFEVCFGCILLFKVDKLIRQRFTRKFDRFGKQIDRHVIPVAETDHIGGAAIPVTA